MVMQILRRIIRSFLSGALDKGVLQMILIFILAGAFAGMARGIGSVDATVAATLHLIPGKMLYAGIFITACIISFSVGTSVGTIVAVTPIACGIAADTGVSLPFIVGIVVGGAFFGDNLSFISDTTLAATKALGVRMKDKFKANIKVVLPAVILTLGIYVISGLSSGIQVPDMPEVDPVRLIPYILVITLALGGMGVNRILGLGIAACITVACISGLPDGGSRDFNIISSALWQNALDGVLGMVQVIVVAMVAGGLLSVVKEFGWFDVLTDRMTAVVHSKRGALGSIAALVSATNLMTANNTVAILSVGGIAHDIAVKYDLDRKQTAGILDMFSCLVQSLIPYGAQLLMASAFAGISGLSIIPCLFYPLLMGICATISILRTK